MTREHKTYVNQSCLQHSLPFGLSRSLFLSLSLARSCPRALPVCKYPHPLIRMLATQHTYSHKAHIFLRHSALIATIFILDNGIIPHEFLRHSARIPPKRTNFCDTAHVFLLFCS